MTILGNLAVGSSVYFDVGGTTTEFIIVHQGLPSTDYDTTCDGTWVLIEEIYEKYNWDLSNNSYSNSEIHDRLNTTIFGMFDSDTQAIIKNVKIPYVRGIGTGSVVTGSAGLLTNIFLLSANECGWTDTDGNGNIIPQDGVCLDYFKGCETVDEKRIGYYNGVRYDRGWGLRSPRKYDTIYYYKVTDKGGIDIDNCYNTSVGVRFAMILDPSATVDGDITIGGHVNIDGEYRELSSGYINVNGEYRELTGSFKNINGTYEE